MLAPSPTKPAAICVSNTFRTSVSQARRRMSRSWRPACTTTSISGSASSARDRRRIWRPLERVEQRGGRVGTAVLDPDRHQAQQGPVAALGDELGVEADATGLARAVSERSELHAAKPLTWRAGREGVQARGREQPAQASGQLDGGLAPRRADADHAHESVDQAGVAAQGDRRPPRASAAA